MKEKRRGSCLRKRWKDNITEWTAIDFVCTTWAAENRTRWKWICGVSMAFLKLGEEYLNLLVGGS